MIIDKSYAALPFKERLRLGKLAEAQMYENLKNSGYYLKPATQQEDMELKIDGYLSNDQTNYFPFQSKYRQTGIDIGMDIYEPWYGPEDFQIGRDSKSKAIFYVTQVNDKLYLMHRQGLHSIVQITLNDWKQFGYKYHFGDGIRRGTFNSAIPGVQLKFKVDESNNKPKIIVYIAPSVVKEEFRRTFTVKPIVIEQ
jgi:hypothetical protein